MIRQNFFRQINKAKRTRRKSHLKSRERHKWLIDSPVDRLSKEFKDVEQSLYIGLCGIRKELKEVAYTLNNGLGSIDQHFTAFETPIESAAEKIAGSFENFDKSKDILSKELREEYHAELKKLVVELRGYAHQLVETNNIQIERSTKLEKNICDLSTLTVLLNDTIKLLGALIRMDNRGKRTLLTVQAANECKPAVRKGIGNFFRRIWRWFFKKAAREPEAEATGNKNNDEAPDTILGFPEELLKEFTSQYKSSNENFEKLFNSINGSLSQVKEHIHNQSEIDRALLRKMEKVVDGINSMTESFKVQEKADQPGEEKEKVEEHAAEQSEDRIDKMDLLIDLLSEGFQGLKDQNKLMVKKIKIISDQHLKLLSKFGNTKRKIRLRKHIKV
ncbi:MAG: hypothetical protein PVH61_13435 [Candidatus Aminicenantes bacterium]